MAAKNTKLMHEAFGRTPVVTHDPDPAWPLPSELIGIEIEVENPNRTSEQQRSINRYWTTHSDGSLRNGVEYVLPGPTGGRQLTEAINAFFDSGMRYDINPRTSIHVHINASDNMTVDQFRNMFVIMYLIEPSVFRWADENRKWCGYCAPLTDLNPRRIINILNDSPNSNAFISAVRGEINHDRYYGYNVAAFHRHGTVEFRYFPCTTDKARVIEWVKFCMYVKKVARRFEQPEDILRVLTNESSVQNFLTEWFPDISNVLIRNLDITDCLSRVKELRTMVNVSPDTMVSPDSHLRAIRSRGFSRYLVKNFPALAGEATSTTGGASGIYETLQATPAAPRARRTATPPTTESVVAIQRAYNEAAAAYQAAQRTYHRSQTVENRTRREAARLAFQQAQLRYHRVLFGSNQV